MYLKKMAVLPEVIFFGRVGDMEKITINKTEYRKFKAAKDSIDVLSNVRNPKDKVQRVSFTDLRGALRDVKEFKSKTSVEVQKMIPELCSSK